MRVSYVPKKFKAPALAVIEQSTAICEEYAGMPLTLRQLYYQHVARGLIENTQQNYKRIADIINDARLAGLFDWDHIVDRTRNLQALPTWASPQEVIEAVAKQFRIDLWAKTKQRIEVWIEKDAAIGVIERICEANHVPYFSCRGYVSQSEMYAAGTRVGEYLRNGEQTLILHIGDHDPSGLQMTEDIEGRLRTFVHVDWQREFMGGVLGQSRGEIRESMRGILRRQGCKIAEGAAPWEVRRIALTIEQVEQYNPPPNFAKTTDSRFDKYFQATGLTESWEMDALDPFVLEQLIQDEIDGFMDGEAFHRALRAQEVDRQVLQAVSDNWETIRSVHAPKTGGAQ